MDSEIPARPILSFNTFIRVGGGLPTGRDKSGPPGAPRPFTRPLLFRYSSVSVPLCVRFILSQGIIAQRQPLVLCPLAGHANATGTQTHPLDSHVSHSVPC